MTDSEVESLLKRLGDARRQKDYGTADSIRSDLYPFFKIKVSQDCIVLEERYNLGSFVIRDGKITRSRL